MQATPHILTSLFVPFINLKHQLIRYYVLIFIKINMNKLVFLFLSVLSISTSLFAQDNTDNYLTWNSKRKLTWKDFKAAVPAVTRGASASTATQLHFSYSVRAGNITYDLNSFFNPEKSWVKDKTDLILGHEQGHFDIAEIYIRKLYKALQEYTFDKKTYKKDLQDIYRQVAKDKDVFQNEYDAETNHSINVAKQKEWEEKIKGILKELEPYAKYK